LGGGRFARDVKGKEYRVPADITYPDWKEKKEAKTM
jgi:hypothetical protein